MFDNDERSHQIVVFVKKDKYKVMKKTIFSTACFLGMFAIILGAFGAHGLQKLVKADALAVFETGVHYQMYHVFLLFVLGLLPNLPNGIKRIVFFLIVIGVILFSFSLYLLAINELVEFDFKKIGFLTPIGGTLQIIAWGILGYTYLRRK